MQTHKPTQPILVPATPENGELCTTRYTKAVQAIVTSFTTSQRAIKAVHFTNAITQVMISL